LVTTEGAGRSIPEWPLTFGQVLSPFPISGLAKLAWIHRLIAAIAFLGVGGLAISVWRASISAPVKWIAGVAALVMVIQIFLGGAVVLMGAPDEFGFVHSVLAHVSLLLVAGVAAFTSPLMTQSGEQVFDYGWPSLRSIARWTPPLVLLQIMLGSFYRHHILGLIPHIVGAMLVAILLLMFALFVLTQFPKHEPLRRTATGVLIAMFVQVMLGVITYMSGSSVVEQSSVDPLSAAIVAAHVTTGSILLVLSCLLAVQVRRFVLPKFAPAAGVSAAS
jgi:cytochrome c oxidase assembly protein subunit 15